MVPLAEFLSMDEDDTEGIYPYIWATDKKRNLVRMLVSEELVDSCKDRLHFWKMLKDISGVGGASANEEQIANGCLLALESIPE